MEELKHHGVLGMKWGIRKERFSRERSGASKYHESTTKKIKLNKDGSKTIPSGFKFNRVGAASLDINKSGALYVSSGKEDAARYIRSLGPTPIGKLLGTAGSNVQHITVKDDLKMPSNSKVASETAKLLLSNNEFLEEFNKSLYVTVSKPDADPSTKLTREDIQKALSNPDGKEGQKLAYSVSSMLGDPGYVTEAKKYYQHFRDKGYDAVPDLQDILTGTSSTSTIIINPDKIKLSSSTPITKEIMKETKKFVKDLGKIQISDLIKD